MVFIMTVSTGRSLRHYCNHNEIMMTQRPQHTDALLTLLQQRLINWGDNTQSTPDSKNQLTRLLTQLYQAQKNGIDALPIKTLQTQYDIDIKALTSLYPTLISHSERLTQPLIETPLVCFSDFVGFRRQVTVLQQILTFLQKPRYLSVPPPSVFERIQWTFAHQITLNPEQQLAAITAASVDFCIITGGAGTGKTTTLAKALELQLLTAPNSRIILAAPTGKAAHRLNTALAAQQQYIDPEVRHLFSSLQATTIHRLLGISEHTGKAFYHHQNPLACDVLAIDEASMIGADVFTQIIAARLPHTRLILLGDANQLPAINSSAFFREISQQPLSYSDDFITAVNPYLQAPIKPNHLANTLTNSLCRLHRAQRFAQQSLIDDTAAAILQRHSAQLKILLQPHHHVLSHQNDDFLSALQQGYHGDKTTLLTALETRMILCANRQGPFGSDRINAYLDDYCRRQLSTQPQTTTWYHGRRIIIEQNDYTLNLNNGDMGRCEWHDNRWMIIFDDNRRLSISELTPDKYRLGFAISIHKSQGSEYPHVDIVLDTYDADNPNPLITPALLYTAVTRAKTTLTVYSDMALLDVALNQPQDHPSPLLVLLDDNTQYNNNVD